MKTRLAQLQKKFPIPEKWGQPEIFTDNLIIGSLDLKMVGLSLGQDSEHQATGCAVEPQSYPWARAYFELFERASLLNAEQTAKNYPATALTAYNHLGAKINDANYQTVFNTDRPIDTWQYSKSNGVAIQTSLDAAIKNAGWEILERDRILRFWYSRRAPQIIVDWQSMISKEIHEQYEISAYSFNESRDTEQAISIVAIFGFPKVSSEAPLIMGFGAGINQNLALNKAIGEVYQRLAFLWGAEKLEILPELKADANFHLEYYQCPASWPYLKKWLNGKLPSISLDFSPVLWQDLYFVHLPILTNISKIYLVKALSKNNIPLVFGNYNPKISFQLVGQTAIHPIA